MRIVINPSKIFDVVPLPYNGTIYSVLPCPDNLTFGEKEMTTEDFIILDKDDFGNIGIVGFITKKEMKAFYAPLIDAKFTEIINNCTDIIPYEGSKKS